MASVHAHETPDCDSGSKDGEVERDVTAQATDHDNMNRPGDPADQETFLEASSREVLGRVVHTMNYELCKDEDWSGISNLAAGPVDVDESHTFQQPHLFKTRPVRTTGPNANAVLELGSGRIAMLQDAYSELSNFLDQIAIGVSREKVSSAEAVTLRDRLAKLGGALTERLTAVRYLRLAEPYEDQCGSLTIGFETAYNELSKLTMTAPTLPSPPGDGDARPDAGSKRGDPRKRADTCSMVTTATVSGTKPNPIVSPRLEHAQPSHLRSPLHSGKGPMKAEAIELEGKLRPERVHGGGDDRRDERNASSEAVSSDKTKIRSRDAEHNLMKVTHRQSVSRTSSSTSCRSSLSSLRRLELANVIALKAKREALARVNEIRQRELDIKNDLERAELDVEIVTMEARAMALDKTQSDRAETDSILSSLSELDRVTDLFLERDDDVAQDSLPSVSRSGLVDPSFHTHHYIGRSFHDDNTSNTPFSVKTVTFDMKLERPSPRPHYAPSTHGLPQDVHVAGVSSNVHSLRESIGQSGVSHVSNTPADVSSILPPTCPSLTAAHSLGVADMNSGPPVVSLVERPPSAPSYTPFNVHSVVFQPRYAPATPPVDLPHHYEDAVNTAPSSMAPLSGHSSVVSPVEPSLAKSIADAMAISRLPVPKPLVFSGDPLEYPAWIASFQHLVRNEAVAPADKMLILRDYISGPAREAVGDLYFNLGEASYNSALEILRRRFGEDYTVAQAMRNKLDTWPEVKFKDAAGLRRYADYLRQCLVMSREILGLSTLNDPAHIKTLSHKLPDSLALSWGKKVAESKFKSKTYPSLDAFVFFLECQADALFEADLQAKQRRPPQENRSGGKNNGAQSYAVGLQRNVDDPPVQQPGGPEYMSQVPRARRCTFCDNGHYIQDCDRFAKESFEVRKSFALRKRLCFKCLRPGHSARGCVVKVQCKQCKAKHVTVMHDPTFQPALTQNHPTPSDLEETAPKAMNCDRKVEGDLASTKVKVYKTTHEVETRLYSLFMPVYVSSASDPSKEELVYAMLDTMSDTSFLTDSVMDTLELETQDSVLTLTTLTSTRSTVNCRRYSDLRVRAADSDQVVRVPLVYSQTDIDVDKRQIPTNAIVSTIPHLCHLSPHFSPLLDAPVALLLGVNAAEAFKPLEVVSGESGQPFALRTRLGWGLVGEVYSPSSTETEHAESEGCLKSSSERTLVTVDSLKCFRTKDTTNERLIELIERDFTCSDEITVSQDDHKFLKILSDGIKLNSEGHYEMPLPFRDGNPQLPYNRHVALRRLHGLKRKFLANTEHFKLYQDFVSEMLNKGDAEQVPREEIDAKAVWYIPHHGVYNPTKPGKIRVVFDCAPGARKIVDSMIHRCVPCTKQRGKPLDERMADLPSDRTEVAPPFTNTGLDCFGPFFVREGRRTVKRYGLILTCLVSRAVHLELIEDMSTDAFICRLRRFIALRGNVKLIRCDRGTNFVGAERELREACREMNDAKIVDELSERNCKFLFNPPTASHFGGVWERMIRIVRQILSDLVGAYTGRFTSDALATLFHEVASIVNNRPLCPANLQDPSSCVPLTPNHLLTLRPEPVFPPPGNFQREDMYARKRWRRVQFLANEFWVRWKREYLPTLQPRKKWFLQKDAIKPGILVLMADETAPPGVWRLARVEKIYPSSDGLVRSVQLCVCSAIPAGREQKYTNKRLGVQTTLLDRPIHKLVPLNIKSN